MGDRVQLKLHRNHRAIFIHGLGGTRESREKQALTLSTWIYQHPPGAGSKIEAIENKSIKPKDINEETRNEVVEYMTSEFMLENTRGELRLVIFCHSNGVKVTESALKQKSLQDALEKKYPSRKREFLSLTTTIRSNVAVVAFGGVSLIADNLAKMVLNFRFEKDVFSKICHYLGFGNHGEPNAYFRFPSAPDDKKQLQQGFSSRSSDSLSCGASALYQLSSEKSSSSGSSENPHFLDKYLKSAEMINYIIKMLGLPNQYHTANHV